jgi:Uma2 family endonuclease
MDDLPTQIRAKEICLVRAPEICVEVLSPSNTSGEISEKIALYFEAGAREVWISEKGTLQFYFSATSDVRPSSEMCPEFPSDIN